MPKIKIISLPKHQIQPVVGAPSAEQPATTEEQMQQEADRIWMGQGAGSKGQPIVGTTNSSGVMVGGVGAQYEPTTTTTEHPRKKFLKNLGYATKVGLGLGNMWARENEKADMKNWEASRDRRTMFTGMTTPTSRGNIVTNSFKQAPDIGGQNLSFPGMYGKYGGEFNSSMKKVMIEEVPEYVKMAYGGQTKYGLNIARTDSPYGVKPKIEAAEHVSNSISEQKNGEYILEAEFPERLWRPGKQTLDLIGSDNVKDKHYNGGVKLTAEQVYSDDKSGIPPFIFSHHLKLPGAIAKNEFGIKTNKRKISPADIAGNFELNKYQAILDSKNSDKLDKTTAQLMLDKNNKQLAKLAVIHEAIKGEQPPEFAMEMLGEVPTAKLGGYIKDKYLPKFQTQGPLPPKDGKTIDLGTILGGYNTDYASLEKLLMSDDNKTLRASMYENFKKSNPNVNISEEQYINNFLEAQKQFYAINNAYKDNPSYLASEDWDKTEGDMKNKLYVENSKKLGFTPLTEEQIALFQQAYRDLYSLSKTDQFKNTFGDYFMLEPIGVSDEKLDGKPISPGDKIAGNTTIGQLIRAANRIKAKVRVPNEPAKVKDAPLGNKWVCIPDERGNGVVQLSTTGMGYDTPEEAKANCLPAKLPPFDFTSPAKMQMLASLIGYPIYESPLNPFISGKRQKFWFNDWQAAAQQAFTTGYAANMRTLGDYTPGQGVGAMGSLASGRTAELIGTQIVPQTGQTNTAIANQAEAANAQEARRVELFNVGQKEKERMQRATLRQQESQAITDFAKNIADVWGAAMVERGDLYDLNMLTNYYKDPRTLKTKFKGQPANIFGAGYSYPGSTSGSTSYATVYNQNLAVLNGTNLSEEEKKKEAILMTRKALGYENDDNDITTKKTKTKKT